MRRGFNGIVRELVIQPQQPHGKGGGAEYANRRSDAMTAAMAASPGDACRSMIVEHVVALTLLLRNFTG